MKKSNEKRVYYLELVFKIGFLLYSLLSFNSLCYGKSIISIALWPTALLGAVVLLLRLIQWKEYIVMPGILLLVLFIISYIISALVNIDYGYKSGLIKLVFLLFYFFIFFTRKKGDSITDIKKETYILGMILQVYMFICVMISFIFLIFNYAKVETVENGWDIGIGFLWGRLWGVFTEPNYASVCACVVIVLASYFHRNSRNKYLRVFFVINSIMQVFYIAFTDSRTGQVTLGVVLAILIFNHFNYLRLYKVGKKKIEMYMILIFMVGAFAFGVYIPKVITTCYNQIASSLGREASEVSRGYDLSEDPTNRRFDIWKSGLEVFSTTPLVGTSYTNILPYTLDNCKGTYLVNNSAEKNFSSIHNEVLNILVGQGILGIFILLAFIGYVIVKYIKYYFKVGIKEAELNNVFVSTCVAAVAGAMFLTGMFYSNSPVAVLFWAFLGGFLKNIQNEKANSNFNLEAE